MDGEHQWCFDEGEFNTQSPPRTNKSLNLHLPKVMESRWEGKCSLGTTLRHKNHPPNVERKGHCRHRASLRCSRLMVRATVGRRPNSRCPNTLDRPVHQS
jgi:hypothetical protein